MQADHPLCPLIHANEWWCIGKDGFPSVDAPWPSRSGRVSDAAMRQESSVIAATAATPAATAAATATAAITAATAATAAEAQ